MVSGLTIDISDGDVTPSTTDDTAFGDTPTNFTDVNTFTITNTGTNPLTITSVLASGDAEFSVTAGSGAATVLGNSTGSFQVTYDPNAEASHTGTITMINNINASYTFSVSGTGVAEVLVPGCLGDPGDCTETTSSSFTSNLEDWGTVSGWDATTSGGVNTAHFSPGSKGAAGVNASISQNLTGLSAAATTLLVKLKVKVHIQSCNATGRFFDMNVKFGGTTYLNFNLIDTDEDATLNLLNGGLLVATDLASISTHFTPGGCIGDGGPDVFATIYLSIPKGAATDGDLAITVEDTGETTSKVNQLHLYIGDIEATADAGACGFMWLKADSIAQADASEVTTWSDSASGGNDATSATGPDLQFNSAAGSNFNFNPSVSFNGTDQFLYGTSGYSSATQFVVFKHTGLTNASSAMTLVGTRATDDNNDRSGVRVGAFSSSIASEVYGVAIGTTAEYGAGAQAGTVLNGIIRGEIDSAASPPTDWTITRNGGAETVVTGGAGFANWVENAYTLGASTTASDYSTMTDYFDGEIAEVLSYPAVLATADVQKINTYLAIKYGLTLSHDYIIGAGTTVYDQSSYASRIFGIGYEACQGLHQRQSQSQDDSDTAEIMLTIGYNGIIGSLNESSNGNDMTDGDFVVMGDDNAARASWTATDAPTTAISEATRIAREWKVQVTSAPPSNIRFKLDGTKLPAVAANERVGLVIADNAADIATATLTDATDKIMGMTLSGTDWLADVDLSGYTTAYFTFIKYQDCYTDLVCTGTTKTWNGVVWIGGAPTVNDPVILAGNYNTGLNGDFHCCTLQNDGTLTITDGTLLEVESHIVNNSVIDIQNNGSLMQYYDAATNTGAGTVTITRTSQPMFRADYTYWSAPVTGFDISGIASYNGLRWQWDTASAQWLAASGNMESGKGYIIMTDNTHNTNAAATTVSFAGTMYNGRVTANVDSTGDGWNLLGNPYPSALNADDFINENHTTRGVTTGGLYFWTHNSRISGYNDATRGSFNQTDYAVYTLAGGVGTTDAASFTTDVTDGDGLDISYGGNSAVPDGFIAAGQAFFVEATATSVVEFKNCMRNTTAGNNDNFYRNSKSNPDSKDRFWLEVENKSGSFKQLLFGYFRGADDGIDGLYDAEMRNGTNTVQLYTMQEDDKGEQREYSIQGQSKESFTDSNRIAIGFRRGEDADVENRISLHKVDGAFEDKTIYLKDKITGALVNLSEGSYVFEESNLEVEDRFEIRFEDIDVTGFAGDVEGIRVSNNKDGISISSEIGNIQKVTVYNQLGKTLYSADEIDAPVTEIEAIRTSNSLLIITIYLTNGTKSTVKVIH